jgi:hypothetical protein
MLKRLIKRGLDVALKPLGLEIVRPSLDFDSRPTGHAMDRMLGELADAFNSWCVNTQVWPVSPESGTLAVVGRFYEAYLASPFRDQAGGSRFNNLLWLHLVARVSRPTLIIDSGTYRGASAWALASAVPGCPVLSFDLDLSAIALRTPGVTYVQSDWTTHVLAGHDLAGAMAYFDDHVDQGARLMQAVDRGIGRLVFDDDFPLTSFAAMAHDGAALPKIAFVLDRSLDQVSEVTWRSRGRECHWPVDHARLAGLRAVVAATERLPNTSLITGIHQTPYRLVRVRKGSSHGASSAASLP